MKIFLITDYFWPSMGGLETSTLYLAECLQREVSVEVLTATENKSKELDLGFKVKRFTSYGSEMYKEMAKYMAREEEGFGVSFMGFSQHFTDELLDFVQYLKREHNCKILFTLPSVESFANFIQHEEQFKKFLEVDYIFCLNTKITIELIQEGIPKAKLVTRTNGIPAHHFIPASKERKRALRQQLGIDDKLTFIFTGRFSFVKRVDLLVEAFAPIEDVNLVLVGEFDPRFAKNYSFTVPENSGIQVFQPTSNILPFLQAADVYVSASRSEGMSISLLEAMSSGLPALVSDIEGHQQPIQHSENGYFFQSENLDDLQKGIQWFIQNRNRHDLLSDNARRSILAKYSIEQVAEVYIDLISNENRVNFSMHNQN